VGPVGAGPGVDAVNAPLRAYVGLLGAVGTGVLLSVSTAVGRDELPTLLLFAAAVTVGNLLTLAAHSGSERFHHGYDVVFVVAGSAVVPAPTLVGALALGQLLARLLDPLVRPSAAASFSPTKLTFNVGKVTVGVAVAAFLVDLVHGHGGSGARTLLIAGAAGVVFESVDQVLLRCLGRLLPRGVVPLPTRGDAARTAVAIAGGMVVGGALWSPAPTSLVLTLTVCLLVPISAVLRRSEVEREVLAVTLRLLDAGPLEPHAAEQALVEAAKGVTHARDAHLDRAPPRRGEGGVEVVVAGQPRWLVVRGRRGTTGRFTEAELELLRSVGAIGQTMLGQAHRFAETNRRAERCELTGLLNRRGLHTRYERAAEQRPGREVALLFIDLDGFKAVNDTHGHEVGDRVLEEVARRLERCVRSRDAVCRWAGDEFVILAAAPVTLDGAAALADRIRGVLQEPFAAAGDLTVTGSVGVAVERPLPGSLPALVQLADHRMYATRASRARAAVHSRPGSGPTEQQLDPAPPS
jgi:diguanylate cyclase (GGDEF)-like protein